jgi:anti-sigma factor RsiW
MTRRIDPILEETMNLYLDGRLTGPQRAEFERRIERDEALREAVEFHRGLTLEFQEEAPALPRDFTARARARLDRTLSAGGVAEPRSSTARRRGVPWWRSHFTLATLGAAAAALLVVLAYAPLRLHLWPGSPEAERVAAAPDLDADEQTRQALRSLGYIASGKPGAARPDALQKKQKAPPKTAPKPLDMNVRTKAGQVMAGGYKADAIAPAAAPPPAAKDEELKERVAVVEATPPPAGIVGGVVGGLADGASEAAAEAPAPAAQGAAPAGDAGGSPRMAVPARKQEAVRFRLLPLGRSPEPGRDHLVIRSAAEWTAFLAGAAPPSPAADFEREMVVVLRDDLGTDPPSRLRVVSVTRSADVLLVECRVERPETASNEATPATPGQAVIVPAAGRETVTIVVK